MHYRCSYAFPTGRRVSINAFLNKLLFFFFLNGDTCKNKVAATQHFNGPLQHQHGQRCTQEIPELLTLEKRFYWGLER